MAAQFGAAFNTVSFQSGTGSFAGDVHDFWNRLVCISTGKFITGNPTCQICVSWKTARDVRAFKLLAAIQSVALSAWEVSFSGRFRLLGGFFELKSVAWNAAGKKPLPKLFLPLRANPRGSLIATKAGSS